MPFLCPIVFALQKKFGLSYPWITNISGKPGKPPPEASTHGKLRRLKLKFMTAL
jgi:hypothetical protein